ncbi:MAG: MBOAT family O-acyltransferase [Bacteroidota bacterium]
MLFNSLAFLLFFPLVVGGYFLWPPRHRWMLLLAASYFFYGWWRVDYLALILFSTLVDYVAALAMGRRETRAGRRPFLLLSLASNLGLLFSFKYLGFFTSTADALARLGGGSFPVVELLLPVGISFYTFQTLAYTIDVYRGRQEPERHLGIFALYVSFFPQLVAGPIERSQHLLPQFHRQFELDEARIALGLRTMLWGFFIKCVVADRLAPYVDLVYNDPGGFSGLAVWTATYAFAFQIYGDFAGYSLIAIGAARVMGYDLMDNFHRPYFSKSISEFWRRWHISLSTWFRDYLYIPLGGNRVARWRWYVNMMVVFAVSGLWHGAAWTFVVWGVLHGAYLAVGAATGGFRDRLWARAEAAYRRGMQRGEVVERMGVDVPVPGGAVRRWWQMLLTFHLVLLAWVFFRAEGVEGAVTLIERAFAVVPGTHASPWLPGFTDADIVITALAVLALVAVDLLERRRSFAERLDALAWPVRWGVYLVLAAVVVLFGSYGETTFIYFQF